jgi:hypothetical protein
MENVRPKTPRSGLLAQELAGSRMGGVVEELGWGTGFDDGTAMEEGDAVRYIPGELHVVGDEEHGEAVIGEATEDVTDLLAEFGVEGGGGFVEEERARFHGEGAGDGDALLLSAGELGGTVMGAIGEANPGEEFEGLGFDLAARAAEDMDGCFEDVFEGGEVREEVELLEDHPGAEAQLTLSFAVNGLGGVDGDVVNGDAAGVRGLELVEAAEEGGLAAAGWPDEHDRLRGGLLEVDPVEDAV